MWSLIVTRSRIWWEYCKSHFGFSASLVRVWRWWHLDRAGLAVHYLETSCACWQFCQGPHWRGCTSSPGSPTATRSCNGNLKDNNLEWKHLNSTDYWNRAAIFQVCNQGRNSRDFTNFHRLAVTCNSPSQFSSAQFQLSALSNTSWASLQQNYI